MLPAFYSDFIHVLYEHLLEFSCKEEPHLSVQEESEGKGPLNPCEVERGALGHGACRWLMEQKFFKSEGLE